MKKLPEIADRLLEWYDAHARDLPWRIRPQARRNGALPDPYRIWLSEIMLQQTTVKAVIPYFLKFIETWPTVEALARAQDDHILAAWAGLGYYARARNLIRCAREIHQNHNGMFPQEERALLALPGVGPYTAAAIAAIAFDQRAVVLDGNIERVMSRLYAEAEPLPRAKKSLKHYADLQTPEKRCGDYAQAVMDLGAEICKPSSPRCELCPLRSSCAAQDFPDPARFPYKTPKAPKPTRYGSAFVAISAHGDVYLERRPPKGLLGGMLGWPGSDWGSTLEITPPFDAEWTRLAGEVRHSFTHFHLCIVVFVARPCKVDNMMPYQNFSPDALPSVMKKIWKHAMQKTAS